MLKFESSDISFKFVLGLQANDTGGVVSNITYYSQNQSPAVYFDNYNTSYVFSNIDNDSTTIDTIQRVDMNFIKDIPLVPIPGGVPLGGAMMYPDEIYSVGKPSSFYQNFYLPQCASGVTDVHGFKTLFRENVYKGIDIYYNSNEGGLKHYFVIKKTNPNQIVMRFTGADSISHSLGTYSIHTAVGTLKYDSLVAYEIDASGTIIPNTMQPLDIYADTANGHWHFVPFNYNVSNTLVILAKQKVSATPPQNNYNINWCTYWGEGADDNFTNLTHDDENNVIFCGNTTSLIFPPAAGMNLPDSTSTQGLSDAVIIKINDIMEPQWLTFIGGSKDEKTTSIAAKNNGNLVCVGSTRSDNLPLLTPTNAYVDTVFDTSYDQWLLTELGNITNRIRFFYKGYVFRKNI